MEDSKSYGVTMLITSPTTPPSCLGELTVVAHTSEAGQQRYYKVEEVEALVARLTTVPASDEVLAELEGLFNNPPVWGTGVNYVGPAVKHMPAMLARVRQAEAKATALQAFKDYVHRRFDEANIDRHDEQNAINGCRVGKRFDDLERYMQLTDPQKTREALVAVANGLAEAIDEQNMQLVYELWRNVADVLTTVDSSTISSLRLIVPPTVKGGQQDA